MPGNDAYVVRNTDRRECKICGQVHEFISRASKDHGNRCGTPIGFSEEVAQETARIVNGTVERPKDNSTIILDDSARKLPQNAHKAGLLNNDGADPEFVSA